MNRMKDELVAALVFCRQDGVCHPRGDGRDDRTADMSNDAVQGLLPAGDIGVRSDVHPDCRSCSCIGRATGHASKRRRMTSGLCQTDGRATGCNFHVFTPSTDRLTANIPSQAASVTDVAAVKFAFDIGWNPNRTARNPFDGDAIRTRFPDVGGEKAMPGPLLPPRTTRSSMPVWDAVIA